MSDRGFSFSPERLREIACAIVDHARSAGASACEVDVSEGFGQSVTVRRGEVETIEYNRDKGVGVTVYLGSQRGHASTADFGLDALRAAADAALSIARFTAPDPCAGLPEPELLARDSVELDLYRPWDIGVEDAIELARRCEAAAFAVSPLVTNSEGASVATQQSHFVSANSLGFLGGYPTSRHHISCSVIAGAGEDMQRDDWYSTHRDAGELAAPEAVGDYAARRALSRLGSRRTGTIKVPVLFEAPLASTLLGNFVHAASGGSLYRKASFLVDRLGEPVFSPIVNISERPHLPRALASAPFDNDGVATHDREVVRDGVLEGYFLGVYSARKLGMRSTGNAGGCHNLIVRAGEHDLPGLLRLMGRGLLVTELLGHGVNYVTGDYSRGAAGFWVEGGEIQYPVHEITIAGNLKRMLRGIVAIGNDTVVRGSRTVGSILIDRMTVAGA
jgi:PmbA protein